MIAVAVLLLISRPPPGQQIRRPYLDTKL
jgi:hypothetical protein